MSIREGRGERNLLELTVPIGKPEPAWKDLQFGGIGQEAEFPGAPVYPAGRKVMGHKKGV